MDNRKNIASKYMDTTRELFLLFGGLVGLSEHLRCGAALLTSTVTLVRVRNSSLLTMALLGISLLTGDFVLTVFVHMQEFLKPIEH